MKHIHWQSASAQGFNLLEIDAVNAQGPAGFMLSIMSAEDGRVLARSDASWFYVANGCQHCFPGARPHTHTHTHTHTHDDFVTWTLAYTPWHINTDTKMHTQLNTCIINRYRHARITYTHEWLGEIGRDHIWLCQSSKLAGTKRPNAN